MPLFDLDTIFGEIAAFLTFDLNNIFNIRANKKKPQFLPRCWDGRVYQPAEPSQEPTVESPAEEEEITKPSKKCSVTAKIKREEYKRIHKIRKCGYEKKSEILQTVSSICYGMRNSEPSLAHESTSCHRTVSSVCSALAAKAQALDARKRRQDSILTVIRKCIVDQQHKLELGDQHKCGNRVQQDKNENNNPTAYYENLQREESDIVVHNSIVPRQEISVRKNFFENLQDQFNMKKKTQKNAIQLAECGVQVRPRKIDKLVGTDEWVLVCKKSDEQNANAEQNQNLNVGNPDNDMPAPRAVKKQQQQRQRKQRQMKQPKKEIEPNPSGITAYLKMCLSEERKLPMSVVDDTEFLEPMKRKRAIKRAEVCDKIKKNIKKREQDDIGQPKTRKRGLIGHGYPGFGRFINPTPSCCPWQPRLKKQPSLEPPKGQPPQRRDQQPMHPQRLPQQPQRPQSPQRPQHNQQPQRTQQPKQQPKLQREQKPPPLPKLPSEQLSVNLELLDQQQYQVQQLLLHQQHRYHCQKEAQERRQQQKMQQQQQLQEQQRQEQEMLAQQQHQQCQQQPQQCQQQCNQQQFYSQPPFLRNAAIANRMMAMLNEKIEKNDVNQQRDVIEARARYLWQLLQLTDEQNINGDWAQLKPHQKLAFSWAVIANQTVFDNPLDNFMDFFLKECTANGKQSLSTELIDRGLAMWQDMDRIERLPFVMEAFVYLVSKGEVNMSNKSDIVCTFRGLEAS